MNKARIKEEAEHFFEWPTNRRDHVMLTSCLIFAEFIAGKAVAAEREACAKVAEDCAGDCYIGDADWEEAKRCAAAIRARSIT